jgi:pilus assembly protein CpaB
MPSSSTRPPAVPAKEARPATPPGLETKTVIVAAVPLRFGTELTADALAEAQWPAASVPPGSFASREALLSAGGKRTVLSSIGKNEPILASKVTGPGQRGSLSAVIDDGKRAITVRVDDVVGVAGFVQPDDHVDVLLTRNERQALPTQATVTETAFTSVLLQDVRVLAIDQLADRGSQARPAKAVTIEVTTQDAQKVALAASVGQLSLALRQAGSSSTGSFRRVELGDLNNKGTVDGPVPQVNDESATMVTVTRGVTERRYYEITSTGRREVKLPDKGAQLRPQIEQPQPELVTKAE